MFGSERRLIIILKYKIDHQEKHWNFQNVLYGSSAICCLILVFTTQSTIWQSCQYVKYGQQYVKKKKNET